MSKDFRHGQHQRGKAAAARQNRGERVPRNSDRREQRCKDTLRHAVRTQDHDTFEDYDEQDPTY